MSRLNCEYVLDVYPDVLNGRADAALAQQVRAHVAACDDCGADIELLEALHAEPILVPAGLHERVVKATRSPQPRWRIGRSELAMVATLAMAVIGGSLLVSNDTVPTAPAPVIRPVAQQSYGLIGVEEAMMSGKASLEDLSIEELESLLKELES